jgi:hypothetical protein
LLIIGINKKNNTPPPKAEIYPLASNRRVHLHVCPDTGPNSNHLPPFASKTPVTIGHQSNLSEGMLFCWGVGVVSWGGGY